MVILMVSFGPNSDISDIPDCRDHRRSWGSGSRSTIHNDNNKNLFFDNRFVSFPPFFS